MQERSRSKSSAPKQPKEYGYRAKAAKRLQTPNYKPDGETSEVSEEDEEEGDGSWAVYGLPGDE